VRASDRHRTANVKRTVGRYSLMPMLFYTPPDEQLQAQSAHNHQGRTGQPLRPGVREPGQATMAGGSGGAPCRLRVADQPRAGAQLARIDPAASTYTQWYWNDHLHNLLHFLTWGGFARAWEIQQYGNLMGMLKRVHRFPTKRGSIRRLRSPRFSPWAGRPARAAARQRGRHRRQGREPLVARGWAKWA